MKPFRLFLFLFLGAFQLHSAPQEEEGVPVVTTTAWTAAFARMAGVTDTRILAPYELRHPSEYELRPSDIEAVMQAEYVIFAGYENMVNKIKEAVGGDKSELIQITTTYQMVTVRESVLKIASIAGDVIEAETNLVEMERFYAEWKDELSSEGITDLKVVVQFFHKPLANELGLPIVGVFGPGPLEAKQIADLAGQSFDLIIDNWHNETGTPLKEAVPESLYVSFVNFPGAHETKTLLDVLEYNRKELDKVLR